MEHNEATHEKMYELLMHAASQLRKKLAMKNQVLESMIIVP
jgi:hypothetical protein